MYLDTTPTPNFLVIGAQKSGTTTLWEDLRGHPDISMSDKESNGLLHPRVLTPEGRRHYGSLFDPAAGRVIGEACTTYAMLPRNPEVPSRARTINPEMRVIYIVREPLARVISHHHHDFALGLCGPDIDIEVTRHEALINNTRYGSQLEPWITTFGREQVLVLKFEDYVADRETGFAEVQRFLGLSPTSLASSEIHNSSATKRLAVGPWRHISASRGYRRLVRPLIPQGLRKRLMSTLLPPAPERPHSPSEQTLRYLAETLRPEVHRLAHLVGPEPYWDLDESLHERIRQL